MMSHRFYNLRTFIRHNNVCYLTNQCYTFGNEKVEKRASMFISRKTNYRHHSTAILSLLRPKLQREINIIGYVNPRWTYIRASGLSCKAKDARSEAVKDEPKLKSDTDGKVLERAVEVRKMNIIRYLKSRWTYIRTSGLFSKWKGAKSKVVKHEPKLNFDADGKVLETAVEVRKMNIIRYLKSRWTYIRTSGLFSKWKGAKSKVVNDKSKIESKADRKVFKVAVRERIIELNAEKFEKIREQPLATKHEQQSIEPPNNKSEKLKVPADLESVSKTNKRSPHEYEHSITIYRREDVEAKALEVFERREALLKELLEMKLKWKTYQQKRRLMDDRDENIGSGAKSINEYGYSDQSKKKMLRLIIYVGKFLFKYFVCLYYADGVFSLAEVIVKLILSFGVDKALEVLLKSLEKSRRRISNKRYAKDADTQRGN